MPSVSARRTQDSAKPVALAHRAEDSRHYSGSAVASSRVAAWAATCAARGVLLRAASEMTPWARSSNSSISLSGSGMPAAVAVSWR